MFSRTRFPQHATAILPKAPRVSLPSSPPNSEIGIGRVKTPYKGQARSSYPWHAYCPGPRSAPDVRLSRPMSNCRTPRLSKYGGQYGVLKKFTGFPCQRVNRHCPADSYSRYFSFHRCVRSFMRCQPFAPLRPIQQIVLYLGSECANRARTRRSKSTSFRHATDRSNSQFGFREVFGPLESNSDRMEYSPWTADPAPGFESFGHL